MDMMKTPGPDHPITIEAHPRRVQVLFEGHLIGDSSRALVLREAGYRPVLYFPREDIETGFLGRTDRVTHCPYKGQAHYFTILMDGRIAENAVWTYEEPYPAMEMIRGRLAFYPNQVTLHEVMETGAVDSPDVVVLHTDAGDGHAQQGHWPANVDRIVPPEGSG